MDLDTISKRTRADRIGGHVTTALGHFKGDCNMHDGDKLGQSAVGELVRSRNKVKVNPFPEGVAFMAKAHAIGVHFTYESRRRILRACGECVHERMCFFLWNACAWH